ncbi:hypothetical protein [Streptomyces sp. TRM70350]|uniref:hypothetical protein n=1 Tax=Streptomyces sp. TRM70350 TaxID=2856165 RepID=UPI001C453AB0|nr:hypothetical protein [Streptomyces sp. TRM70350]MBV7700650.1 hypothetical protein [Streptomyces sp. TRM70350]
MLRRAQKLGLGHGAWQELIGHPCALRGRPLGTRVESTNGILDGRMMAASLAVHRADPHLLAGPERSRSTWTGREPEHEAWIAGTAAEAAELTAAGRCVSHRDREEIDLTFGDGLQSEKAGRILERYGVPATFFCVGMNARAQPADPASAQGADRMHPGSESHAGPVPSPGLRPLLWDVVPDGWSMPGARAGADIILDQARPGSVVLLHDGGGDRTRTVDEMAARADESAPTALPAA